MCVSSLPEFCEKLSQVVLGWDSNPQPFQLCFGSGYRKDIRNVKSASGIKKINFGFYPDTNRPYAHDVISVRRPRIEVKRRLFIGQSMCVLIVSSPFDLKDAAG